VASVFESFPAIEITEALLVEEEFSQHNEALETNVAR
jgi:hypothetical protein